MIETLRFLQPEEVFSLAESYGTPLYVYDEAGLRSSAAAALAFPHAFGLTVRYAMKALPNGAILRLFHQLGLHFDASSGHEVTRIQHTGIPLQKISLSTQELPETFASFCRQGMEINACSLSQLERIGQALPGHSIGLRVNPGLGSGGTNRTNVGGPSSSFGVWHGHVEQARAIAEKYQLKIIRIHTHIGSGSDPAVWQRTAELSLNIVRQFPDVTTLNLGGGYKVGRMQHEVSTDLQAIGTPVRQALLALAEETGRQIHLEIEPGTFLVANNGAVVTRIQDRMDTGADGYVFYKLDAGMTDILRPSLYGAQHPLIAVSRKPSAATLPVIVVGHCCESGDILTPQPGQPEVLQARELADAQIGDCLVIEGAGAYCAAMSAKHYNSFPEAPEVLRHAPQQFSLIRRRQAPEAIWANEVIPATLAD